MLSGGSVTCTRVRNPVGWVVTLGASAMPDEAGHAARSVVVPALTPVSVAVLPLVLTVAIAGASVVNTTAQPLVVATPAASRNVAVTIEVPPSTSVTVPDDITTAAAGWPMHWSDASAARLARLPSACATTCTVTVPAATH